MTLNKAILGILVLAASVFCVLAFGNPQWGKWSYVFQAYYLGDEECSFGSYDRDGVILPISADFSGRWMIWDRQGQIVGYVKCENGSPINYEGPIGPTELIAHFNRHTNQYEEHFHFNRGYFFQKYYDESFRLIKCTASGNSNGMSQVVWEPTKKIDRRKEFGIEVE